MSLRSTGSTLSYKSQQSQSKRNSNSVEKLVPKVTVVTSNHIHYDPPEKIKIKQIKLAISELYTESEVRTALYYSYIVKVECTRPVDIKEEITRTDGVKTESTTTVDIEDTWIIRRNVADFKILDHILHGGCRSTSASRGERGLSNLHPPDVLDKSRQSYKNVYFQYSNYIDRLNLFLHGGENGNLQMIDYFNCSLLLSWFEMGYDGLHKVYSLSGAQTFSNSFLPRCYNGIVKSRFPKQGIGDLTLEVNDIVTVVETDSLAGLADSVWCKGKSDKTFQSGFFPSRCVEEIQFKNWEKPDLASCPGLENLVHEEEKLISLASLESASKNLPGRSPHSSRRDPSHQPPIEFNPDFPAIFGCTLQTAMKWNYALRDIKHDTTKKVQRNLSKLYTDRNCEASLEHVPWVIQCLIEHVNERGHETDGIYRLNGSSSEISSMIHSLDSGNIDIIWSDFDIHSVSSLLKQYFRDLSVSLIPADNYAAFIHPLVSKPELLKEQYKLNNDNVASRDFLLEALDEIMEQLYLLPCTYYHTLKLLMLHLNYLCSNAEKTNMNLYNLAIMWAPNLLFDPLEKNCQDYIEIAKKAKETAARKGKLMEIMIAYAGTLFSDKLTKSTIKIMNKMGCNDELRGKPRFESPDFVTITIDDVWPVPSSSPNKESNPKKETLKLMLRQWIGKTEKQKGRSKKKMRSTSLINPDDDCHMKRDPSVESGMYSYIPIHISTSTKDLRDLPATPDSIDEERHYDLFAVKHSIESLPQSECGSEDSTIAGLSQKIGASRPTDLEHSTSTIRDDPETHVYSQIQKRRSGLPRKKEPFINAKAYNVETYDDDEVFKSNMPMSTCPPNNLRHLSNGSSSSSSMTKEDSIPFIDSTSPTATFNSPPFIFKSVKHDINKSKDSSIDMIEKDLEPNSSPVIQTRQPTAGFGYKYNAGCNVDNFNSDKAYVSPITASNATYQRYFNKTKRGQHGPKSLTPLRSNVPYDTEIAASPSSLSSRRPLRESDPIFFRQSPKTVPVTVHPILSRDRLKVAAVDEGSSGDIQKGKLKGNWGTAYSFDSGVENNGSSNDDLLSNT